MGRRWDRPSCDLHETEVEAWLGGEMSAAEIAFDMEVGEAFEYRENEYREKRKALAVKAVEERAANPPTLKRYDLMVRHLVLSVCATQCPCARDRC